MNAKKRNARKCRCRKIRNNSKISAAIKTIIQTIGLPERSVRLVLPSGRKARSDSTIGKLRQKSLTKNHLYQKGA